MELQSLGEFLGILVTFMYIYTYIYKLGGKVDIPGKLHFKGYRTNIKRETAKSFRTLATFFNFDAKGVIIKGSYLFSGNRLNFQFIY